MLLSAGPALSESQVLLEAAGPLENIGATTFDSEGQAVGQSYFAIETEANGVKQMTVSMTVDGGGRNLSRATLAPIAAQGDGKDASDGGPTTLRLVEQRSQATRADGVSLDLLVIDHDRGRVSCYPPELSLTSPDEAPADLGAADLSERDNPPGKHAALPEEDRVVNVPMQLLFRPLVEHRVDELEFQIAACNDGPVIHRMIAVRGPTTRREGREVVEIRYGPDFGKAVAWFASRLMPTFSFWFDTRDGGYLGHRMPLHRKGPEILLVRQGLTPPDIGVD